MRSTFHGLEVSRRGIFTQQAALYTTGHNISNASTEGFSRQKVNMVAARPLEGYGMMRSTVPGQMGMGVEFSSITRIREKFLDDQFRNENKALGNYTVQKDTLEKLEKIVSEPTETGFRTVLGEFFNAWSDLSKTPESGDSRKIVREQAQALADSLNHTAKQLNDLQADIETNMNIKMLDVNSMLGTISQLNVEINRVEGLGDSANDLRDQRDLLADQISKVININVTELGTGYQISMGGVNLVEGNVLNPLTMDGIQEAFTNGDLNDGEMYGLIESRDRFVQGYINDLDKLARTIANGDVEITLPKGTMLPPGVVLNGIPAGTREVTEDTKVTVKGLNGLHQLGYTLSGQQGVPFFTNANGGTDDISALTFKVNQSIIDDAFQIATAMKVTVDENGVEKPVIGNNGLAVLFSQARDAKFNFGTDAVKDENTLSSFFSSVVGQLGVQTKEAARQTSNAQSLVDQVDGRRQSVSGVSLDEEMSNLIKFQHAYNAAARNMTTIDEMLDRIINGMGVVGR
ncbi:flagellar hook-associated protein FlgK [Paenibacillus pinihumi]|uniref:flagellar hook-associated protein FlgK n=1 Tax=Paenibacillus pinihumi TaxID=669462 RepID=UPI00041984EA|nr:flagellar hook-associated protein FlgK [Paenibacillus pinihumi]